MKWLREQELHKPVQMFPNYALRNGIEEWAHESCPEILGQDGRVLKAEPDEPMPAAQLVRSA